MWWIKKSGRIEGPLSTEEIKRRIHLNMLGSLDRVSEDQQTYHYVKDTELWKRESPRFKEQTAEPTMPEEVAVVEEELLPEPPTVLKVHPLQPHAAPPPPPYPSHEGTIKSPIDSQSNTVSPLMSVITSRNKFLYMIGTICLLIVAFGVIAVSTMLLKTPSITDNISSSSSETESTPDDFTTNDKVAIISTPSGESIGSGFLLEMEDGVYLVTNEHVTRNKSLPVATLPNGIKLTLGEFSVATDRDLARFKIPMTATPPFKLNPNTPKINDPIFVYGNSLGGGVVTESKGILKGVGPVRLETDAEFVQGNSGGPFIDKRHLVVGVSTIMYKSDDSSTDWTLKNTRYDGAVRRFGTRLNNATWKIIPWPKYAEEVARLEELNAFYDYLLPYLLEQLDEKVDEKDFTYNETAKNIFIRDQYGFNEMLKTVHNMRVDFFKVLNKLKSAKSTNMDRIQRTFEDAKSKKRELLSAVKESLFHLQKFLSRYSWNVPQINHSEDEGFIYRTKAWYTKACQFWIKELTQAQKDFVTRMNQLEEELRNHEGE